MLASILAVAAILAADQFTKFLATTYLAPVGAMPFLPGLMELRYVLNDGMAFSMLAGARWLLIVITGAALAALGWYTVVKREKQSRLEHAALLMVIGGGVGNLIDRVLHGYVVDFFATTFVDFAVFNVADCFVVVGVILLAVAILRQEFATKKDPEHSEEPSNVLPSDGRTGEEDTGDAR